MEHDIEMQRLYDLTIEIHVAPPECQVLGCYEHGEIYSAEYIRVVLCPEHTDALREMIHQRHEAYYEHPF